MHGPLNVKIPDYTAAWGGGEIFDTCPDRSWGPPSLLCGGYRVSFPGLKRRGMTLFTHPIQRRC